MKSWQIELVMRGLDQKVGEVAKDGKELSRRMDDIEERVAAMENPAVSRARTLGEAEGDELLDDAPWDLLEEAIRQREADDEESRGDGAAENSARAIDRESDVDGRGLQADPDGGDDETPQAAAYEPDGDTAEDDGDSRTADDADRSPEPSEAATAEGGADPRVAALKRASVIMGTDDAAPRDETREESGSQEIGRDVTDAADPAVEELNRMLEEAKAQAQAATARAERAEAESKSKDEAIARERTAREAAEAACDAAKEAQKTAETASEKAKAMSESAQDEARKAKEDAARELEEARRIAAHEAEAEKEELRRKLEETKAQAQAATARAERAEAESKSKDEAIARATQPAPPSDQAERRHAGFLKRQRKNPDRAQQEPKEKAQQTPTRSVAAVGYMEPFLARTLGSASAARAAAILGIVPEQNVNAVCRKLGVQRDAYLDGIAKAKQVLGVKSDAEVADWVRGEALKAKDALGKR